METPDWFEKSLCKKKHIDLWYPPLDSDSPDKYYRIAREICHRCPVWKECLEKGKGEVWGMWGGLTPLERTAITNKNPKPTALRPHGTHTRYRQGCRCSDCETTNATPSKEMNIKAVPFMTDDLGDLDVLMFLLLGPLSL